ncbi:protein of unknown function DUF239 [Cynara cardunculus var. scolymus]|uniref:Neprosin PEP catalytic domain-containing protein n=1 Tax=Cynara cardunculus var. scolymus TaxID=59895 RepID=A0A103YEZ5_CYNCS|nr:protein of unknown function DUF239 [Cynara cardunculus var. scolymus]
MVRLSNNLLSRLVLLHLWVALFCNNGRSVCGLNYTRYRQVGDLRLARIQKHLDNLNKPSVFSIQSPDGDIIDCIHKRKQAALDHPLLKNHKIQRVPPEMPKARSISTQDDEEDGGGKSANVSQSEGYIRRGAWQMWHQNGERCPKGTVPVRRSTVHDVLRANSLYDFGKKRRGKIVPVARRVDAPDVVSGNGHEHAIAYTGSSNEIYGAKATINVWDPKIEVINEFSLSQIWVLSGSFDGSDLNSIEAGWQSDAYQATGCYNLLCSGFVQTNSRIAIGAAISPLSAFAGSQFDVTIVIWKDPKLGNWWMGFGDNTLVGYWPAELFTHLADKATMVEWGGEVVNSRANGEHTSTEMGSGHFAEDGFGKASYFRNLEIVDSDNSLISAHDISTLAENTNCYNIKSSSNNQWGTYFYYGGPGKNAQCH